MFQEWKGDHKEMSLHIYRMAKIKNTEKKKPLRRPNTSKEYELSYIAGGRV